LIRFAPQRSSRSVNICPEVHMRARLSLHRLSAFAFLAITLTGCAGGGGSGGASEAPRRGSSTRIVADELAGVAELDLYTAVNRLRPTWLRPQSRGTLPVIIVDGTPQAGGVDSLRSMRASDVAELQYMSASDATTRYGTGYTAGAIVVSTRR
jgi:hypothetical protein